MSILKSDWEKLRDSYPPLEIPYDREEQTAFERFVADMGFDGIIGLTGDNNDKSKASDKRGK